MDSELTVFYPMGTKKIKSSKYDQELSMFHCNLGACYD